MRILKFRILEKPVKSEKIKLKTVESSKGKS